MGRIATFYSYKGGVGRTAALANIGVLLARRQKRVLLVDFDLEAPGLDSYFHDWPRTRANDNSGTVHLLHAALSDPASDWRVHTQTIRPPDDLIRDKLQFSLSLISSGAEADDYGEMLRDFSWAALMSSSGGSFLNRLRVDWSRDYDFVLIDSRTGLNDTSGICTVLLPDVLVFVFTANEQSFANAIHVVQSAQQARQTLAVPRPPLAVLPLPGRFDGRDEVDLADRWLDRFAIDLKEFYDDWLPAEFSPRQIIELTKVPYVARFSFGESLPVLTHGVTDPEWPGLYLENAARLLASDFADAPFIIDPSWVRSVDASPSEEVLRELGAASVLRQSGRNDEAESILRGLTKRVESRFALDPGEWAVALAGSHSELGEILLAQRRVNEALSEFERAAAVARGQLGRGGQAGARQLTRYVARLAEMHVSMGNQRDARRAFEDFIAITERLARSGPDGAAYQRDLSVHYNTLGDLMRAGGELEEASTIFEKALAIAERNASAEPDRADYQRDLSVSYNNLGDLMLALGQGERARAFFEKSLAVRERLARGEPDRADYQRDLSVSYNKLGDLMQTLGHDDQARAFFERDLAIAERLARAEPDRADYLRDLSVCYSNLGDLTRALDQGDQARAFFEKALAIAERLARGEPDRADYQRDLAVSIVRMAELGDNEVGRLRAALAILQELRARGRDVLRRDELIQSIETRLRNMDASS